MEFLYRRYVKDIDSYLQALKAANSAEFLCVHHKSTENYWSGCDAMFAFTCKFTDVLMEHIPYLKNNKTGISEKSSFFKKIRGVATQMATFFLSKSRQLIYLQRMLMNVK